MTHFAKIEDNVVVYVIVAEQDYIDNHAEGTWVQTSYNTRGGVHYGQDRDPDDGVALNKNFAGAGSIYVDGVGFHAPQPYPSWTLDSDTFLWEPPVARPDDGQRYGWDEDTTSWVEMET
jgi:hypothetical protein|tara:strand:- start:732 stop:1088 length:357 start_codon:yes stop_codon:yes gene_type:complete